MTSEFGISSHESVESLVAKEHPDFVVIAVPPEANAAMVRAARDAGTKALIETPPAADVEGLRSMWREFGADDMVQVAEQYSFLPGHVARTAIVDQGVIGAPTSVQISSTHTYHAISLIRHFLSAGYGPVEVRASSRDAMLADPLSRSGWSSPVQTRPASNVIATLDFPEGMGLYDFTSNQWHNQLRHRRIVIRGTQGEIVDDSVLRLSSERFIVESTIARRQIGYDLSLDSYDTAHLDFDGDVVFENAYFGSRFMDEELAIAHMLTLTGEWASGRGNGPYSLRSALQDAMLGLAVDQACATGTVVTTGVEDWAG